MDPFNRTSRNATAILSQGGNLSHAQLGTLLENVSRAYATIEGHTNNFPHVSEKQTREELSNLIALFSHELASRFGVVAT